MKLLPADIIQNAVISVKQHNYYCVEQKMNPQMKESLCLPPSIKFSQTLDSNYIDQVYKENSLIHSIVQSETGNLKSQKTAQKALSQGRMKLRDYLFFAKTASSKNASKKRKAFENLPEFPTNKQPLSMKMSKAEFRNEKYSIKNSEMFKILKEQMDNELLESINEIKSLKQNLDIQISEQMIPSNGEMMMMYQLRSIMNEKLKRSLRQMKELIYKQAGEMKEERVEMEIVFENDESTENIEAFGKQYIQLNDKKITKMKNTVSFGK